MTHSSTRRQLLSSSSAALASAALTNSSALAKNASFRTRSHGDAPLRIDLVGCGGRGTGAASQALSTTGDVKLVAMADAFDDRLQGSLSQLTQGHAERMDVPEKRRFTGFDAYEKAIACDVDVVILATPPGFRPMHFEHDKHVFMEKPVATDAGGIRTVLAAAQVARNKKLKVGVGLQRHH